MILYKRAHEGPRSYQKRLSDPIQGVNPHSPLRVIASGYLSAIERSGWDVQGAYRSSAVMGVETCSVSSVGGVKAISYQGMYPLDENPEKEFVADFRSMRHRIRAREIEFLVACAGYGDGTLHFEVSYDATAIDDEMVKRWKELTQSILEPHGQSRL